MKTSILLLITCLAIILKAESPKEKLTKKEAEQVVYANWLQILTEKDGISRETSSCRQLRSDGSDSWDWIGELSIGVTHKGNKIVINADVQPMQIDFHAARDGKVVYITPCIWKIQGSGKDLQLIIVEPDGSEKPREDGDYSNSKIRPTSFETTKENKYTKETYVPCVYLEQFSAKREKEIRERVKALDKKK